MIDTFFSATDLPLFLGVDTLSRSSGQSISRRVLVGFLSLFVTLDRKRPRIDLKLTPCKVFGGGVPLKRVEGLWLKLSVDFDVLIRKTREGWNCRFQKTPRTEGWVKVQGSVDERFAAGLPFPVPETLESKGFCDSGRVFLHFSRDFRRIFLGNPEEILETATVFSSFLI